MFGDHFVDVVLHPKSLFAMVHKRLTGQSRSDIIANDHFVSSYQIDSSIPKRRKYRRSTFTVLFIFPSLMLLTTTVFFSFRHYFYDNARPQYSASVTSLSSESELYDFVQKLRKPTFLAKSRDFPNRILVSYDVDNCPEDPPQNYPTEWPIIELIQNWNPNTTFFSSSYQRPSIYQGICRFNFQTEYHKAVKYRQAELPFVLRDDPPILQVVHRWHQPGYLEALLGNTTMETEYSTTNQLMYFKERGKRPPGWKPPMETLEMNYKQWLEKAQQSPQHMGPDQPHWYFRVNAKDPWGHHPLYKEMPFFAPENPNFYLVDANDSRGINCRFGMQGNTAATHFDASRNFILLIGGERRYILSSPINCPNLALFPHNHPSGRHSKLDWSNPNLTDAPEFARALGNEIVLQAGDVLYLPTYWFHYIISLDLNWQCNARSGMTREYDTVIRNCGF